MLATDGSIAAARAVLERILTQNMVPFWLARLRDPDGPGYRLNHDARGVWKGPAPKRLVKQARVLWFTSRLKQSGRAPAECDALMQAGFDLLRDTLWDHAHGGFFWEVAAGGTGPTLPDKHVYGQAQALYGVAQFALVSGDRAARAFADEIFAILETRFHDAEQGGYHEFFRRDWAPCPDRKRGYLGEPPGLKLFNSHLHLLEALIVYSALTGAATAYQRIAELVDIIERRMVHASHGALTNEFAPDWRPLDGERHGRASYGHDLEAIHLLNEARRCLGLPAAGGLPVYRRLFEHARRFGYGSDGGVHAGGRPGEPADDLRRIWWVQAEALLGALTLYRLTGEKPYADAFTASVNWIARRQVDWEYGEWHAEIAADGTARGDKADAWKGPYHNGRALIEAIGILDRP